MNKYEEALQRISNIDLDLVLELVGYEQADKISPYGISDYPNLEKSGDIETLKELVDKATPKKPHHFVHETHTRYYCPECSKRLKKSWSACPRCTSLIDWSDES